MVHNMTTIQIKHRHTNAVLFECEAPDGVESGLHMRHALEKACDSGANLSGANLRGANLIDANLIDAYLIDAYLTGANLRGANLTGASLTGANLRGANLRGAYLTDANLRGANLIDAYLTGANLRGASLTGANLTGANLTGANLTGANLTGANLTGASLTGELKLSGDRPFFSVGPIGSRSDVFQAFTTDHGLRLKTGCFFGALDDFRAKLIDTHDINPHREEYEAALLLIEKHAALWPADKTQE